MTRKTARRRAWRATVGVAIGSLFFGLNPLVHSFAAGASNLAAGKATAASSTNAGYVAGNINDGNQGSYWEGSSTFPSWVQVDLGATASVNQAVLKLPSGWGSRTETLAIQGSSDGTSFATIVGSTGYTFNSPDNTVTVNFPSSATRFVRLAISANTGWQAPQLSELELYGPSTTSANLASGKAMSNSGNTQTYVASNANDANQATYWEGPANAYPQWLQVDLGSAVSTNRVVVKTPVTNWGARSQTFTVQGSTDGTSFSPIVASAAYAFDPSRNNTVTIDFNATTTRYVRLSFTANTGSSGGQVSELEVYGPTGGDVTAPSAPSGLAYTESGTSINLTWNAATDNVAVTAYDVYANNVLRSTVSGSVRSYSDTQPTSATVSYVVKARDAAGNQSPASNTVTRTGAVITGDTTAPSAPSGLAQSVSGTSVALTWNASTDNVGVAAYDVFADGSLLSSTDGGVRTYTATQAAGTTVTYTVKARDAAGNVSAASNAVTATTAPVTGGSDQAAGKPITASSVTQTFAAGNANDGNLATYWEGNGYPSSLTVSLGANVSVSSVVVKLNPDPAWGTRTQTIQVLGRDQGSSTFNEIKASATYTFTGGNNVVSIPVSATAADIRLVFTANSGAGGGQVAELQVIGVPAPNPDLTVSGVTSSPSAPVETDAVTLSATVKNSGTATSGATNVNFYLGTTKVGTAAVAALAAGASTTVTASIGQQNAATYAVTAKVDEANTVIEQNDANNSATASLTVKQVASSDLLASGVSWSPGNPSAGNTVTFTAAIKNQGTVDSSSGSHSIDLTITDATNGAVVKTLSGSYTGTIAAGATSPVVNLGSWTAVNGKYAVKVVVGVDSNELAVKQANNTSTQSFFVGRGANMPYDMYEAEDGSVGGGAAVVGPNRTIGDVAGEASGRKAVTLNSTGSYVQWTTRASTNTLVTRFSIPDAQGGDGTSASLNIYVNNTFLKSITLTSHFAWLYGAETGPGNSPSAGGPRHIYDEANILLGTTVPAGSTIKLQKDSGNTSQYAIDFVSLEQATQVGNPDASRYVVPAGFTQQAVQTALDTARQDTTKLGVYLPAGDYSTINKFQVYGRAIKVVGAGPWFTRFFTPQDQSNTDAGFRADATANGSTFAGFGFFGNYTSRIDGPGKVFDFANTQHMTIDNIWAEHVICLYWGANTDFTSISNSRIRDTFADGVNMTNGSTDNHVFNNESRATGDDSFALFSAIDSGGADEINNVFENLTSLLTWRAAGIAVYGGYANTFRNIYVADTLCYAGVTISSLDFGYPMNGFGASPTTNLQNMTLARDGGHFWGTQVFPAIWVFSASKVFQGIRVSDVDIIDPTYIGIMFQTNYSGGNPQFPVKDTVFTNVSISGAHRSGDAFDARSGIAVWANEAPEQGQGPAVGTAVFNNLRMTNNDTNIRNSTSTFTIVQNP